MIWNLFKKESEKEDLAPPFEGVVFVDTDGKRYDYKPAKTVSPHDVAMLIPLFSAPFHKADRFAYIRKHNLEKHFKLIKPEDEE